MRELDPLRGCEASCRWQVFGKGLRERLTCTTVKRRMSHTRTMESVSIETSCWLGSSTERSTTAAAWPYSVLIGSGIESDHHWMCRSTPHEASAACCTE